METNKEREKGDAILEKRRRERKSTHQRKKIVPTKVKRECPTKKKN